MIGGLGITNSIAPFQQYIGQHQLLDRCEDDVGFIFSLSLFLTFFGSIFDAIGPRLLILAGSVVIIAPIIVLGDFTEYWHFTLDFPILGGLGRSLLFTPSITVVGHSFFRKRAFATEIVMTGFSMGGIIFQLVFNVILIQSSFAWSTRALGLIILFLVLVANLLIRERLPKTQPSLRSLLPDLGIFANSNGCLALCTAGLLLMELVLFVPLAYLTSFSIAHGISDSFSNS